MRVLSAALAVTAIGCGARTSGTGDAHDDNGTDARAGDAPGIDGAVDAAPTPDGGPPWIVPPIAQCPPPADACAAAAAAPGPRASYRKDAFLDDTVYKEDGDRPTDGGRVEIAALAASSGHVTRLEIDGVDAASILTAVSSPSPSTVPFEWTHVYPAVLTAGAPLWIAFHSRSPSWDQKTTTHVHVETDQGVALDADVPFARTPAPITYVTTSDAMDTLIIHVRNADTAPHTAAHLYVDGRDVLAAGIACVPEATVAPSAEAIWTVPLCAPAAPGDAWTVAIDWADAPPAVGVGRVLRPFFPIETWQNTEECPLPGANDAARAKVTATGIDTLFVHGGTCGQCGCDTQSLLAQTLPATPDLHALVTSDVIESLTLADTSRVAGAMTGDESDGSYYDGGVPAAAEKADEARRLWDKAPELAVYNGGKTNKKVGAFAGMTDVQGMDLYVAACAPHITTFGSPPPLRGAYDYLRNARDNAMPGPTWLYAQGLHSGWNKKNPITNVTYHVQPDPPEILVQAMSVVAAGGKGFLWFQSSLSEADAAPSRWQAMSDAGHLVRAVRHLVRVADPTGGASGGADVLAESLRAPHALVVPVIDLKTSSGVDDLACQTGIVSGTFPHWTLAPVAAQVQVHVPDDLGALDVFEVTPTGAVDAAHTASGRDLTLPASLDADHPVRLFVIADSTDERARVAAALP